VRESEADDDREDDGDVAEGVHAVRLRLSADESNKPSLHRVKLTRMDGMSIYALTLG
jgi:hypothetical protein